MKRSIGTRTEISNLESDEAIRVENLHKSFKLPTEKAFGLKQAIFNGLRGIKGYKEQKVLKGISFKIKKGDFVGIVGRNGSGKSTLLKILAGTYYPGKGNVVINGSLIPFIELGVGFNPELTGRENIYLNGALLGFSNDEVDDMYQEIVDFAELHDFMDQKLKNYSSGMQVRLAFSIAIRARGDILLLDEVLAVGDAAFQRKCFSYFAELKREKKTVILVTHSMESVQQFCNRAIMIEDGKIIIDGSPLDVAQKYLESNNRNAKNDNAEKATAYIKASADVSISKTKFDMSFKIKALKSIDDFVAVIGINKNDGQQVYRWASDEKLKRELSLKAGKTYTLNVSLPNYFPIGKYNLVLRTTSQDRSKDYGSFFNIAVYEITSNELYASETHWRLPEDVSFTE